MFRFLKWVSGNGFFVVLAFLIFIGALFWANARDPFRRIWFTLDLNNTSKANGIILLPKMASRPLPVVVYFTDNSDKLLASGSQLRELAEMGLATVGIERNKSQSEAAHFLALSKFYLRQEWADASAIAWITHQSISDAVLTASTLQTNGIHVELFELPQQIKEKSPLRMIEFRIAAESCLLKLRGQSALDGYESISAWQEKAKPVWVFLLPACLWGAGSLILKRICFLNLSDKSTRPLNRPVFLVRWGGLILSFVVIGFVLLYLLFPQVKITPRRLVIARNFMVSSKDQVDFEYLARKPIWSEKRIVILLSHLELANYNRLLVNWKLDHKTYQEFVLSPEIDDKFDGDMNWRRTLWVSFYPRIRKESSLDAAAEIVAYYLRGRVTISEISNSPQDIEHIWERQITTLHGYERLLVAALRSAGIQSQLNAEGQAEFFDGRQWKMTTKVGYFSTNSYLREN